MKFEEAQARILELLDRIVFDSGTYRHDVSKLILDLYNDRDLSPDEKLTLLTIVRNKGDISLSMRATIYDFAHIQPESCLKCIELIKHLLDKNVPANDVFEKIFLYEGRYNTFYDYPQNFCFRISAYYWQHTPKQLFDLLSTLHEKGVSIQKIFASLMKPFKTFNDGNLIETNFIKIFDFINPDLNISVISSALLPLIKKYLAEFVNLDAMYKDPDIFVSQLEKAHDKIQELLNILPKWCFIDDDLDLLKDISATIDQLKNFKIERLFINDIHAVPLVGSYMKLFPRYKFTPVKSAALQCTFSDENLTAKVEESLSTIFDIVPSITFKKCRLQNKSIQLISKTRSSQNGQHNIQLEEVAVDITVLSDLLACLPISDNFWTTIRYDESKTAIVTTQTSQLPMVSRLEIDGCHESYIYNLTQHLPSGVKKSIVLRRAYKNDLTIADANVVSLEIRAQKILRNHTDNNAFLRFLSGMSGLHELNLCALDFDDSTTRLQFIRQALQIPGLTILKLDFPITEAELKQIMEVIALNQNLIHLQLPQGHYNSSVLLEVVKILHESNKTLQKITFAQGCIMPPKLHNLLKRNCVYYTCKNCATNLDYILAKFTTFAEENTRDSQRTVQLFNDCDNEMGNLIVAARYKDETNQMGMKDGFTFYWKLSLAFSYFLKGFSINARVILSDKQSNLDKILELFPYGLSIPHYPHPDTHEKFFQNIFDACKEWSNIFIRPKQGKQEVTPAENLLSQNADKILEVLVNTLKKLRTLNKLDKNWYQKIDDLLCTILKQGILLTITESTEAEIRALRTHIENENTVTNILAELDHYLKNAEYGIRGLMPDILRPHIAKLKNIQRELTLLDRVIKDDKPKLPIVTSASAKIADRKTEDKLATQAENDILDLSDRPKIASLATVPVVTPLLSAAASIDSNNNNSATQSQHGLVTRAPDANEIFSITGNSITPQAPAPKTSAAKMEMFPPAVAKQAIDVVPASKQDDMQRLAQLQKESEEIKLKLITHEDSRTQLGERQQDKKLAPPI